MIAHTNRGRLTIDTGGNWRLYTNTIPHGSTPMGTVRRGVGDEGALVRIDATGIYVQINAGVIRTLPQHKITAALNTAETGL